MFVSSLRVHVSSFDFSPFTKTSSILLNWHEYKAFPTISHDYDACLIYLCLLEKTFLVAGSFSNPISIYSNIGLNHQNEGGKGEIWSH